MPADTPERPDNYRPIFERLDAAAADLIRANTGLIESHQALVRIGAAMTDLAKATQHARDEHADTNDTVHRLESLITDLLRRLDRQAE